MVPNVYLVDKMYVY